MNENRLRTWVDKHGQVVYIKGAPVKNHRFARPEFLALVEDAGPITSGTITKPDGTVFEYPITELVPAPRTCRRCRFCETTEVHLVTGYEPYTVDHWGCPLCDSTYDISEYPCPTKQ